MHSEKRFQLGERVLVKVNERRQGLPAKVVGFHSGRVRVMLWISGCELELLPADLDPVEWPQA